MSFPMYYAYKGAEPPPRNGASHATIYTYGPFKARDGKTVMLGLQNEREWVQFCETEMQNKALATDPRFNSNSLRHENKQQLEPIILKEDIEVHGKIKIKICGQNSAASSEDNL